MIDLCTVNYNTGQLLKRQIDALHADLRPLPRRPWRLWIADNGSTDDTATVLDALCIDSPHWNGTAYEDVAAYQYGNIGYSAACNRLAALGTGDIIGLLNADAWLSTNNVMQIQQSFDHDPGIAILGPKQRNEQNRITHAGIVGTNTHPTHRGWKSPDPNNSLFRDRVDCVTVSGSAYFIRRRVWDELSDCPIYKEFVLNELGLPAVPGAFLPTEHFYEETWCSYHARAHGHRVVYDGHVSIGHSWHASSPVGSQNEKFRRSQAIFRRMCALHQIECD